MIARAMMLCVLSQVLPQVPPRVLPLVPPLDAETARRVQHARDDAGYLEDAFEALALYASGRPEPADNESAGDAASTHACEARSLGADPAAHRGEVFCVAGTLAQRTRLPAPFESFEEWFLRLPGGDAVIVYVHSPRGRHDRVAMHAAISINAVFYKRMTFTARDGNTRSYPALVGAWPRVAFAHATPGAETARHSAQRLAAVGVPLLGLLMAYAAVRAFARSRRGALAHERAAAVHARAALTAPNAVDAEAILPDDPAEALAELHRRALGRTPN